MKNQSDNSQKLEVIGTQVYRVTLVAWLFVSVGFGLAVPGVLKLFTDGGSLANLANVGSYFQGAVGSLWTLASFLFIYVAFLGQKEQLILQRESLEHERELSRKEEETQATELKEQRQQFALQQESIKRQNFESAFFRLLNQQNEITNQIRYYKPYGTQGQDNFTGWFIRLGAIYREKDGEDALDRLADEKTELEIVNERYGRFYEENQNQLGHYFRVLYHVIKFVDDSDMEPKRRYTSLARAQLSMYELGLVFYDGLSRYGEKFKPLIERYGLLEHLDKNLLFNKEHAKFYTDGAYK